VQINTSIEKQFQASEKLQTNLFNQSRFKEISTCKVIYLKIDVICYIFRDKGTFLRSSHNVLKT
jgi:hypothetical protein